MSDSKHEFDDFDLRLLSALQVEGRLTNAEVGEKIGLSASQCSRRRQRLEQIGVIAGYQARLDSGMLGFGVMAMVQVSLSAHSRDNAAQFREFLARVPEVQEAYSLTGESDYLMKVIVRDLAGLSRLINDVILPNPMIAHIKSSIILDVLKHTSRIPLERAR